MRFSANVEECFAREARCVVGLKEIGGGFFFARYNNAGRQVCRRRARRACVRACLDIGGSVGQIVGVQFRHRTTRAINLLNGHSLAYPDDTAWVILEETSRARDGREEQSRGGDKGDDRVRV